MVAFPVGCGSSTTRTNKFGRLGGMRTLLVLLLTAMVFLSSPGFAQLKDLAEAYKVVRTALCTLAKVANPGSDCPLPEELIYPLGDQDLERIVREADRWTIFMWKVRYMDKPLAFVVEEIQRRGKKEEIKKRGPNDLRVYLVDTDSVIEELADRIGNSSLTYQGDVRALVLPPAVEDTFLPSIPLFVTNRDLAVGIIISDGRERAGMTWWTLDGGILAFLKQLAIQGFSYVLDGANRQEEAKRARKETP